MMQTISGIFEEGQTIAKGANVGGLRHNLHKIDFNHVCRCFGVERIQVNSFALLQTNHVLLTIGGEQAARIIVIKEGVEPCTI